MNQSDLKIEWEICSSFIINIIYPQTYSLIFSALSKACEFTFGITFTDVTSTMTVGSTHVLFWLFTLNRRRVFFNMKLSINYFSTFSTVFHTFYFDKSDRIYVSMVYLLDKFSCLKPNFFHNYIIWNFIFVI